MGVKNTCRDTRRWQLGLRKTRSVIADIMKVESVSCASLQGMFLVLDADSLLLVGQEHSLVKGYRRAVLTPNVVEFKRLCEQVVGE